MTEGNTFDKMAEAEKAAEGPQENTETPETTTEKVTQDTPAEVAAPEAAAPGEMDLDDLTDKPVGEKFERVLLDEKTIIVSDAQIFPANGC